MRVNNPKNIGKWVYIADNSYNYNIETKEWTNLVTMNQPVQIISPPFMEKNFRDDEHEFIKVKYNNQIYVVLNCWRTPEEQEKHIERKRSMTNYF
jgi:hypothetical protein